MQETTLKGRKRLKKGGNNDLKGWKMFYKAGKCCKRQEEAGKYFKSRKGLYKAGKCCVISIDNQVSALEEENRGLREYTENLRRFFI